ncbi:MAG: tetratricopeptide repeat protein [Myxococcales bacterium]|nr:tetratricopeptide repeat protein [Myxococcales bacterium]
MRNYPFIARAFLGATALSTLVAACEEVESPKQQPVTTTQAPSQPERRVQAPTPEAKLGSPKTAPKIEAKREAKIEEPANDDAGVDELLGNARDAINRGELNRALKLARLATKKAPNRSAAFNTLGRVQLKRGERKEALASFEKAVELNPSSSYAENNLGLALIYAGKYDEAVDALEDATALEPVEPYMWNNLGMAYEHLDRLDEARDAYEQAVAAAADDTAGVVAKANLVRLAGVKSVKPVKTAKADTTRRDGGPQ